MFPLIICVVLPALSGIKKEFEMEFEMEYAIPPCCLLT